jgi:hypothetical protein
VDALAAGTLGSLETSAGRCDDAVRHLHEIFDLADRFDSAWLAAWSWVQLGTVAVLQGRLDQARELLDDALTRSVQAHSTRSVTLCLTGFARLALAEGDPEQAALLAAAVAGVQRRAGLRAWPMLRQGEAELTDQIRQAQDPARFTKMTEARSRLSRQEAMAVIRHQHGQPGHQHQTRPCDTKHNAARLPGSGGVHGPAAVLAAMLAHDMTSGCSRFAVLLGTRGAGL